MWTVFLLGAVLIPVRASAEIRLTEIAWMGIAGDNGQYGEWLELRNDGDNAVDLAGWKLYGDGGGQLLFTFSKTIPAGGYLVVERTTASMPDPVPGIDDEHGMFGGGGLSNTGEDLVLKDAAGATVQSLNYASGWPAGDADSKQTMQWDGTSWITAAATPKAPVASIYAGDSSTESAGAAKSDPAKKVVKSAAKQQPKTYDPHIELVVPRILDAHVPYAFTATVYTEKDRNPLRGVYRWNFGDGTVMESHGHLPPAPHIYQYPGTYTLWFGYYRSEFDADPLLSVSTPLAVRLPELAVSIVDGISLQIENKTATPVDLSGWSVQSNGFLAIIPAKTVLGANARIILPQSALRIPLTAVVQLFAPDGSIVHTAISA